MLEIVAAKYLLKIEIDEIPHVYDDGLEKYFKDLDIKKNNFYRYF